MAIPTETRPEDLAARVAELHWYHTLELAPGVRTPGYFDTRPTVGKLPLPASLAGKRCLDVGTWDGFWAFEMERRGAASVTAIDIEDARRWDWPPRMLLPGTDDSDRKLIEAFKSGGASFELAREALGSAVDRIDVSVYDLDPGEQGRFDFVFLGSLLLHLRDPVLALARVRAACAPGGEAVIADTVDAIPSWLRPRTPSARLEGVGRPWWWIPNVAGLQRMVESAGFELLERTGVYFLPTGAAHPPTPLRALARFPFSAAGREQLINRWRGIPHAAVRARPLGG
jgi:tRNA (mo5U34)-methyltransferase